MNNYEWIRTLHDGIYQFVGFCGENAVETGLDVTDGKCRELWGRVKTEFPDADGYRSFCAAYRDAAKEFKDYTRREESRYSTYWGARKWRC